MKTVAMVDGLPNGWKSKTRMPSANFVNNKWVQNVRSSAHFLPNSTKHRKRNVNGKTK